MIYNIITSTPNSFNVFIKDKMLNNAILNNLIKINIWNIKLKKKTKIQRQI